MALGGWDPQIGFVPILLGTWLVLPLWCCCWAWPFSGGVVDGLERMFEGCLSQNFQ